ncbi:MAG: DUF1573 domain-containing protein, partial [Candidatus Bipolaricaulota bacterium]|nr:DUF1573 domain-containing protein [Candidatus Bipolaricaulota bacterium]
MKKVVLAVLLGVLSLGVMGVAAAKIQVDSETYDFGSVIAGRFVSHGFIITNAGNSPLTIKSVRTSCGCTVVDLEKTVLAAGESRVLQADMSTNGYHGRIEKRIYVESDDHTNAFVTLRLTGVVNSAQPFHMTISNLEYMFYLLVDLRDADTYANAHLMGAINIPVDKLSEWTDRFPKKALVILYDEDGTLSDPAA